MMTSCCQSDRKWRRTLLVAGVICLCIGMLPWLGLNGGAFMVPGWGLRLPLLNLVGWISESFRENLYFVFVSPLALLGEWIHPFGEVVFFPGEGAKSVRPFMMFLFYHLVGIACIWRALRHR